LLPVPASAATLFDNYPISATQPAFVINLGNWASDSFTLAGADSVNGVNFGAWLDLGDTITTVDWSLGTLADGSDRGSGTATVNNIFDFAASINGVTYNIYSENFSLGPLAMGPGTYYLTLQNAVVTTSGDEAGWDVNNGPVDAWTSTKGHVSANCDGDTCGSSFQILGDVPEPGSLILFGSGMLVLAGALRKFRR